MLLGVRGAGKARLKRMMHSAPCVVRSIIWFAKRKPCIGIVGFRHKNLPQLHALSLQHVIFVGSLGTLGARRPLPANMRSSSPHGGTVEGAACIDAWHCHFRDVPVSAGSVSAGAPDLESDVRRLRREMYATPSRFDCNSCLQTVPLARTALRTNSIGLTMVLCATHSFSFFELVHCWAVVPSVWRSAVVTPLHKTGAEDEFSNYRPISLLCCGFKIFESKGCSSSVSSRM